MMSLLSKAQEALAWLDGQQQFEPSDEVLVDNAARAVVTSTSHGGILYYLKLQHQSNACRNGWYQSYRLTRYLPFSDS